MLYTRSDILFICIHRGKCEYYNLVLIYEIFTSLHQAAPKKSSHQSCQYNKRKSLNVCMLLFQAKILCRFE